MPVFDNFSNSQPEALARAERITGRKPALIQGDIRDSAALLAAFRQSGATSVLYFACLKAVSESAQNPLACYDNNVVGTVTLLEAMTQCGVKTLAFNSSATVFGDPQRLPLCEYHPLSATNPYGQTRLPIENMLRDQYRSDPSWRIGILRYFNPVGAHESSLIGEDLQSMVRASEQPSGKLVHYQVVPSRWRYRLVLRLLGSGFGAAGLARTAQARNHVRGRLALAKRQSRQIRSSLNNPGRDKNEECK